MMHLRKLAHLFGLLAISGIAIWYWYDSFVVAIIFGSNVVIKFFKLKIIIAWLIRFIFIRLPQRILTNIFTSYAFRRSYMTLVFGWLQLRLTRLRELSLFKLIVAGSLATIIAGVSIWQFGFYLILIYEFENLLASVWRKIWPSLSETAFIKGWRKILTKLAHLVPFQLYLNIENWFEEKVFVPLEEAGDKHRVQLVSNLLGWWKTFNIYLAKDKFLPSPPDLNKSRSLSRPRPGRFKKDQVP